jgi:hypothetical protein
MLVFTVMVIVTAVKAQAVFPGSFSGRSYRSTLAYNKHMYDTAAKKKWFISRYTGITAGYSFFKAGSAAIIAAPIGLQLNRRLNNNLYAFAGISAAPAYINFTHDLINTDLNKVNTTNNFYRPGNLAVYSSAALGLMYINNERTFSVSGSLSIERSSYPVYYNNRVNTTRSNNGMLLTGTP